MKNGVLLEIQDLVVRFYTYEGVVKAVAGLSLEVLSGETLGLVGETGCGKTVTALSILGIVPPPGRMEVGRIVFHRGDRVAELFPWNQTLWREVRGKEIAMIFQEPGSALNPVYRVGDQIAEVLFLHRRQELVQRTGTGRAIWGLSSRAKKAAREITIDLLRRMDIPDPPRVVDSYPHELSGGMKQRVVIAMAVACQPRLLIADEPTTSVDVTVQAQILDLLHRLKEEMGSAILYITHNLGVVAEICDRVAVMYAGSVVEVAEVKDLFHNPEHPYTQSLLATLPRPGKPLESIAGSVPNLLFPPPGCAFHPRCRRAKEACSREVPRMMVVGPRHRVACHLY